MISILAIKKKGGGPTISSCSSLVDTYAMSDLAVALQTHPQRWSQRLLVRCSLLNQTTSLGPSSIGSNSIIVTGNDTGFGRDLPWPSRPLDDLGEHYKLRRLPVRLKTSSGSRLASSIRPLGVLLAR